MGSLNTSPKLPVEPQTARAMGFCPSVSSSWPTDPRGQADGWVRLPASLVPATVLTLIYTFLPRDAAAPSPAMLFGGIINSSIDVASAASAWTSAFLTAAVLAVLCALKRPTDTRGVSR